MRQWQLLFPDNTGLTCSTVELTVGSVFIQAVSTAACGICPKCHLSSRSIHSHYLRTLADLPWQGQQVTLQVQVRKFFCRHAACAQSVFTERIPLLMSPYARRTLRLVQLLEQVGVNTGGEVGSRLAESSGIELSGSSMLRLIRRISVSGYAPPSVIGVDEWSYRRGHRYGTLMCDLERHRPIDLLPERSSSSFADWLRKHPGIEVISRDRGDEYKRGATEGAPQAIQVADRFHLLRNLRDAVARIMDRHRQAVQAAAQRTLCIVKEENKPGEEPATKPVNLQQETGISPASRASSTKRQNRLQRFQQVHHLHQQGVSKREIARQLDIHRDTVGRYLRSSEFPERTTRQPSSGITPYLPYLQKRWQEGCRVGKMLYEELKAQGYRQSIYTLYRLLTRWRFTSRQEAQQEPLRSALPAVPSSFVNPSSKLVALWLLKRPEQQEANELAFLRELSNESEPLKKSMELALQFATLLRHKQMTDFPKWLKAIEEEKEQCELKNFAQGLRQDLAAVGAAIALPWSNGQLEGQVNRLKLIKRQMYGRGKFDLLRARFLGIA